MSGPSEVVVAVTYNPEEDLFLLLKRSGNKEHFPEKWEFPAGFLESEDVKQEALRELQEETGFVGETIRRGDGFEVESDETGKMIEVHPVLVLIDHKEPELSLEHDDYGWHSLAEIKELETVKGLRKDLVNVGVLDE